MTGHSDEAKVAELLAPLRRLEPPPFTAPAGPRQRVRRPVLVAAIVAIALVLTGVAIADGFGAFTGISSAYGPQTPGALKWAKAFQAQCKAAPKPLRSTF
jgi:hypothetical protein